MPGKKASSDQFEMLANLNGVRQIVDLMNEQGISEFELENNGFRIKIKRGGAAQSGVEAREAEQDVEHFALVHPARPARQAPAAPAPIQETAPAEAAEHEGLHLIKSPIVGTFYSAAGPDAPPFVKPGDVVERGQILCIIEAMKLMNEIESEEAGEIAKVFVANGQPVEYGQALFGLIVAGSK
ncbi:MAG: acetyl-CoA carboxylase biotin carboxyl carrier protein [Terriglobia bacterium]